MLIAGAVPRGFRDRLVGAMDAELITGATEAIDEPTDRKRKPMRISIALSYTFWPINLLK